MQLLTAQVTGLQTSLAQHTNGQPLRQLKDELSTLKGLLLNRHQFPASPTPMGGAGRGGTSIPEWQRTPNSAHCKATTPLRSPPADQQEDATTTTTPAESETGEGLERTKEESAVVARQNGAAVEAQQNGAMVVDNKSGQENEEDS